MRRVKKSGKKVEKGENVNYKLRNEEEMIEMDKERGI